MTAHDRRLMELVHEYWHSGGTDEATAQQVVERAMERGTCCPRELCRTVQIADRLGPTPMRAAIEERLHAPLAEQRRLMAVLDTLGDRSRDAGECVFDCLADAVDGIDLAEVDVAALRQAHLGQRHRPAAASALLDALGWERVPNPTRPLLAETLSALIGAAEEHQAQALLVSPADEGIVVGLTVTAVAQAGAKAYDQVDQAMSKQADVVLDRFAERAPGIRWSLEWPLRYGGESIGLGLHVACLVAFDNLEPDPLLAATGAVEPDGRVSPVTCIEQKLMAAHAWGARRVLLAEGNRAEAEALIAGVPQLGETTFVFVDRIEQIPARLADASVRRGFSFDGRVAMGRASLTKYGLALTKEAEHPNSKQLHVAGAAGRAIINFYSGKNAKVLATGAPGPTLEMAKTLVADVFGDATVEPRTSVKRVVPEEWRQRRLAELLETAGAESLEAKGQAESWRKRLRRGGSSAQITLWDTGTCMVTGQAPAFDEMAAALSSVLAGLANSEAIEPSSPLGGEGGPGRPAGDRWIGTDESGKGDYFGPLVSAAVFVDEALRLVLTEMGIRDSKKIKDRRIRELAEQVRTAAKGRFKITTIGPARYNELLTDFRTEGKNLNSLLAWGHTRSIEDLLRRGLNADFAVVDQFADVKYIEGSLLASTKKAGLKVVQYPKAESDIAVAAASVLARDAFLGWMEQASTELGVVLPKGASAQVIAVARQIFQRGGMEALEKVAKVSFKTTQQVVSA